MGYEPALSAGVSSPGSTSQQFDYSSAIDPALEAVVPPPTSSTNQFQQTSGMPSFREELKRELQSASPFSSGASDSPHLRGGASSFFSPSSSHFSYLEEEATAYATSPAKGRMKIDDLLQMGGPAPVPLPSSKSQELLTPEVLDETKHLYHTVYTPGLENFLESKWFSIKGVAKLLSDSRLLEQFAVLLQQFAKTSTDPRDVAYTASVEARVVWALSCMVRIAGQESSNGVKEEGGSIPAPDDPVEAGRRLTVFENLLTGTVAGKNNLTKPVPGSGDHHRLRELEFWFMLGHFVTLRDDEASSAKSIDDALLALRGLLDGRENRDVLYSIAVVRSIGQRVSESDAPLPLHLDEQDARSKLAVAKQFLQNEAAGEGTTNVIRRLCELATRTWTNAIAVK